MENSKVVTTLKFWKDFGEKMLFSYKVFMKGDSFDNTLKGNNSCKMYNFRIEVGYLQTVYFF